MRFHPTALSNESGKGKLIALIKTYFALGGMEMQFQHRQRENSPGKLSRNTRRNTGIL